MQAAIQQSLFAAWTDGRRIELIDAPISACRHSRFNTRKTRDPEQVKRLAERIARLGFERTRALWATEADGGYEIFAGGTRLEAARLAGLESVPVMLHIGYSAEEISRRADEDNENDEYHAPVSPVDVWAEYARLRDEEGWTQERIAQAKGGISQQMVSLRLRLHGLPESVKRFTSQGLLTEAHLVEISGLQVNLYFADWLTSEQAWEELAEKAVHDAGKNGSKSVRALRDDVAAWKEFIAYAERVYHTLPETVTLYELGDPPTPYTFDARAAFVAELSRTQARSLPKVKAAEQRIRKAIADNLATYERWIQTRSAEAARQAAKADAEGQLLSKFHHGDGIDALRHWSGTPIRLLLTDPPYGKDYQSNRRWRTKAPDKIKGDGGAEAMSLIASMIQAAAPHLADDAHVLVFCDPKYEPDVRAILTEAGLEWKGQLIWAKEEHSAGDVDGAFGPSHECIVHAVKGRPMVRPRYRDVFDVPRSRQTDHPTEKPVELLKRLIEATTNEGDLVIDPFAGQASTLVAALNMGRDCWGAELDDVHHEKGAARLLKECKL